MKLSDMAYYLLLFVCSYMLFGIIFNSIVSFILAFTVVALIYFDKIRINGTIAFLKQKIGDLKQKN